MSKRDQNDFDGLKNDLDPLSDEMIDGVEKTHKEKKKIGFASWFISLAVHFFLILVLAYLVIPFAEKVPDKIITTTVIDNVEDEEEERVKEVDVVKHKVEIQSDVMVETPIITTETVTEDHMETDNDMDLQTAEGVSDAISDLPLTGSGIIGNIGGGSGGGGAFGNRSGGGKMKAVLRGGGSKKTEDAVDAALAWLKRHQEPEGRWDTKKYGNTVREMKCAHTGLALLAFLAAGHTDKIGKYRPTVAKGLEWLLLQQKADGSFVPVSGDSIYENAVCALTLAEAYAMSPNAKLKEAAQKAIDYIVSADETRNRHHGVMEAGVPHSIGVLGWIVMASKSAKIAGLNVPDVLFDKLKARLDSVTKKDEYGKVHDCNFDHGGPCLRSGAMQGVAFLSYAYLGVKRIDLEPLAEAMLTRLPSASGKGFDLYRWYYCTLAMFQYGGDKWKTWNKALVEALTTTQSKGGPLDGSLQDTDGSWDPKLDFWGANTGFQGRVYTTAMAAFCLEVYYRYASVYK